MYRGSLEPRRRKLGIEYRTGVKRSDAAAGRTEQAPPLRDCVILYGRFCGGRAGRRASPQNMYSVVADAAASRRRPVSSVRPAGYVAERSADAADRLTIKMGGRVKDGRPAARRSGRMAPFSQMGVVEESAANSAHRPRIYPSPRNMYAACAGFALLGRVSPGFIAEASSLLTSKMGGRVKNGRQAARRSSRPNGAGASAPRRRAVIWVFSRRARRMPHIAPYFRGWLKFTELNVCR